MWRRVVGGELVLKKRDAEALEGRLMFLCFHSKADGLTTGTGLQA